MNIKCPRCKTMTVYDENNLFRPFCSKRCKIIDTAAWAEGEYRVPTEELANEFDLEDALSEERNR